MTESEWHSCDDACAMLAFVYQQRGFPECSALLRFGGDAAKVYDTDKSIHRFYLASCRRIWPLLPQEASRQGIELAENWMDGKVSDDELNKFNWQVEAAAFNIDYDVEPERIAGWIAAVKAVPRVEMRQMLCLGKQMVGPEPRELLKQAAYFADYSMMYPTLRPVAPPSEEYRPFLWASVLRKHLTYPDLPGGIRNA